MVSHILHRNPGVDMPVAAQGDGCYLIDSNGKRYFDGSGGAAVSCLGHSDASVVRAIKDQLDQVAFAHSGFFTSAPAEALADKLIEHAPAGIERVFLVSGGSEAVEAAIKLARQYFVEKGEPQRRHLIARKQSYHGNTIGALSAGGNEWRRAQFEPLLLDVSHISPCYEYRLRQDGESAAAYALRAADELEAEILRLGADTVMAFIAEPVVGATLGAVTAADGYFTRVREICDRYGVLLILDEVMCGMGRTGYLFASEHDNVRPDIVCIAKGLGAGYQPLGAMLCSAEVYQTVLDGSGFFQHGHTYLAHPCAAAAGVAVLSRIIDDGLIPRVQEMGAKLSDALHAAFGQHPHVGDIRGRGLFWGVEFVRDRDSKGAFSPDVKLAARLKAAALDAGLVCYPMSGTIDGRHGDHVLLAPPFIMQDAQVDELVDKLVKAVDVVNPAGFI